MPHKTLVTAVLEPWLGGWGGGQRECHYAVKTAVYQCDMTGNTSSLEGGGGPQKTLARGRPSASQDPYLRIPIEPAHPPKSPPQQEPDAAMKSVYVPAPRTDSSEVARQNRIAHQSHSDTVQRLSL